MSNANDRSKQQRTLVRFPRYFLWGWGLVALAIVCGLAARGLGWTGYWSSDPPMTVIGLAVMVVAVVFAIMGVLVLLFGGLAALLILLIPRRTEGEQR